MRGQQDRTWVWVTQEPDASFYFMKVHYDSTKKYIYLFNKIKFATPYVLDKLIKTRVSVLWNIYQNIFWNESSVTDMRRFLLQCQVSLQVCSRREIPLPRHHLFSRYLRAWLRWLESVPHLKYVPSWQYPRVWDTIRARPARRLQPPPIDPPRPAAAPPATSQNSATDISARAASEEHEEDPADGSLDCKR